jgi:hypothetical protein
MRAGIHACRWIARSPHVPADVTRELVHRVERASLEQTLGEAERHGRVVRPLTRQQVERPTTHLSTSAAEVG